MKSRLIYIAPLALVGIGAANANAGLASAEMFEVAGNPAALWGAPIASLDVNADTGYSWDTGYGVDFPNQVGQDFTNVVTNVYKVPSAMVLNQGLDSITLNAGDRVFAYTITLVEATATTVQAIEEFQVGHVGGDFADGGLIYGRGFITNAGVQNPLGGNATDFNDLGFLWSHDWVWGPQIADQLQNEQTLTVLLFTDPALSTPGLGVLGNTPGQVLGVDGSSNIPVLVPTIPVPGAAAFGLFAGVLCTRRSRRGA